MSAPELDTFDHGMASATKTLQEYLKALQTVCDRRSRASRKLSWFSSPAPNVSTLRSRWTSYVTAFCECDQAEIWLMEGHEKILAVSKESWDELRDLLQSIPRYDRIEERKKRVRVFHAKKPLLMSQLLKFKQRATALEDRTGVLDCRNTRSAQGGARTRLLRIKAELENIELLEADIASFCDHVLGVE